MSSPLRIRAWADDQPIIDELVDVEIVDPALAALVHAVAVRDWLERGATVRLCVEDPDHEVDDMHMTLRPEAS